MKIKFVVIARYGFAMRCSMRDGAGSVRIIDDLNDANDANDANHDLMMM